MFFYLIVDGVFDVFNKDLLGGVGLVVVVAFQHQNLPIGDKAVEDLVELVFPVSNSAYGARDYLYNFVVIIGIAYPRWVNIYKAR